ATIARPLAHLRRQANALLDRRGRLRHTFEASRRLDEIGDLSRALAELTRRLEGHLRFIESFASDVSHELKNPLASIRTASDLLGEVDDPAERARFLDMIQRDVARLERLISGVREVSKIDATLDAQPVERVEMASLLRHLVDGHRLRHPEIRFELSLEATDAVVEASPDRLVQVVDNLVENAAGFAPADSSVDIELSSDDADVVIRVLARGPGIPAQHREKIFHRFFSYRESGTGSKGDHTGLGLSIVKAIVEGYGGRLSASDRSGGGTVFDVRLPVCRRSLP
ncbi:MAG: ATP-binding protein, partial [Acidobacteriota bacterium]